jgi:transposase
MMATGRPTKLTKALQTRICKLIRDGNFRQTAALAAGVGVSTLRTWMAKGRKQQAGQFQAFRAALLQAEQEAEIRMVARVVKASASDARHAQWWLERKRPGRWGRKVQTEVTGKGGGPIEAQIVILPGKVHEADRAAASPEALP